MEMYDILLAKALGGGSGGGGGGGGSSYTLLARQEYDISLSSGTQSLGTLHVPGVYTTASLIYIKVRDKNGKPENGQYYGSDIFISNIYGTFNPPSDIPIYNGYAYYVAQSGNMAMNAIRNGSTGGIYPTSVQTTDDVPLTAASNSTRSGIVDGTYVVEIYALDWPDNASPFYPQ